MSSENPSPATIDRLQAAVPAALAMNAGLELGVFTRLAEGPRDAAGLAAAIGCAADGLQRLLHVLVVAGLLEKRGMVFANTAEADAFLVEGRPGYKGAAHKITAALWSVDLKTAESIRNGGPAGLHDYGKSSDAEQAAFFRALHPDAIAAARDLMQGFDFSGLRSAIDIGGGSGGLVATLADAFPALAGTLLELPQVARLVEPILRATPGGARVAIETGDIVAGPPDGRHDAAILRAVVQVLDPEAARRAIRHAAAALRPGGTLIILGGGILDDDRLGPANAVFLNLTFLNLYAGGRAYTEREHRAWLEEAGCGAVRRTTLPSGRGMILAVRL